MSKKQTIYNNRKAFYDYDIKKKFVAGIVLKGGEIKSIRNKEVSIKESFCIFINQSLVIKNMYVKNSSSETDSVDQTRDRTLLLKKEEMSQIRKKVEKKGCTIIPTKVIISESGLAKIEVGVAVGKKKFDKREALKEKELNKEIDRKWKIQNKK